MRQKRRGHEDGRLQRGGRKTVAGGSGDDTNDVESLEGVAAASLLSDADASGDEVAI